MSLRQSLNRDAGVVPIHNLNMCKVTVNGTPKKPRILKRDKETREEEEPQHQVTSHFYCMSSK